MEEKKRYEQSGEDEIDLLELIQVLLQKAWLIVICFVVGALLMFGYTKLLVTPQYTATATVYILSSSTSLTSVADLQIGTALTADFAEIAKTRPVLEAVIEETGIDESYESLLEKVTTENPTDTHLMRLIVVDEDPEQAKEIANAYADVMADQIADVMNTDKPNIAERAVTPKKPSSPNLMKNVALGGIAGAAIVILILLVRYFMNDTIQTEEDVRKYLNLNTLAAMPVDKRRAK